MKTSLLATILTMAAYYSPVAEATWFKSILVCDGGAAVVDLDLGERRNVQLVIRDRNIVDYFALNNSRGSAMNIRDGQAIVAGRVGQGIFYTGQFRGFEADSANSPAVQVQRDDFGLKVRIVSLAHKDCVDYRTNDYYCAQYSDAPEVEYAEWYFRSCQEMPANL